MVMGYPQPPLRAYQRWTDEDDSTLEEQLARGWDLETMAVFHGRSEGAIRHRTFILYEVSEGMRFIQPLNGGEL